LLVLSVFTVLITAAAPPAVAAGELKGLFRIDPTDCKALKGSYFRMIDPGGGWVQNGSSACGDQTYTNLAPGRDGGLLATGFQPNPDSAFDGGGNGAADRITQPQAFFGARFATATNPTDPQTGVKVPVVVIRHDGRGGLSGDTRAFAAAYQRQHFNQGRSQARRLEPGPDQGSERHIQRRRPQIHRRVGQHHRGRAVQQLHRGLALRRNLRKALSPPGKPKRRRFDEASL
jgi:hypothetical protein